MKPMTGQERAALFVVIAFSAALRLWLNDVVQYSPADEAVYAGYTRTLVERGFVSGYPEITRAFLHEPQRWVYPSPLRWGYFGLATVTASLFGSAQPHALAWLSTLAGILVVPLVFILGRRLFGTRAALLGAAFTAVSPIELALGRRALQDEVFCLAVLAAVTLLIACVDRRDAAVPARRVIAAVAAMTLAFAVKESFLYLYPALLALFFVFRKPRELRWRHAAIFLVPPAAYFAGFSLLARSGADFFRLGRIVTSAMSAPYVMQYQAGPPHRLLVDMLVTAPLVSIVGGAAVVLVALGRERGKELRALALMVAAAVLVFAVVPSKNLRFIVMVDPLLRLLAAGMIASAARCGPVLTAVAAANASIELELFYAIFVSRGVYDPVTQTLLEAVGALPRAAPELDHRMIFPWICAAIAALTWAAVRRQNQTGAIS